MNSELLRRIDLFDSNNKIIMKKYWLKNTRLQILSGFILACSGKKADTQLLDECRETLSHQFGFLSSARDNLELPIMASMAVSSSPERYAEKLKTTYECVSKGSFLPGDFETLAALILMDAPEGMAQQKAEKMKDIYKKMGKNHPFLTDSSDKASAALLSLSDRDTDDLLCEMEECFSSLKAKLGRKGDRLQAMSALLATQEGSVEEKCARTAEICEKLKAGKMNMNQSMALPVVAGLAAIDKPADEIVAGVTEAFEALRGKTGFGAFGLGREGRIIYGIASYLACFGKTGEAAALARNEIINVIIQEIILLMIIMASTEAGSQASDSAAVNPK